MATGWISLKDFKRVMVRGGKTHENSFYHLGDLCVDKIRTKGEGKGIWTITTGAAYERGFYPCTCCCNVISLYKSDPERYDSYAKRYNMTVRPSGDVLYLFSDKSVFRVRFDKKGTCFNLEHANKVACGIKIDKEKKSFICTKEPLSWHRQAVGKLTIEACIKEAGKHELVMADAYGHVDASAFSRSSRKGRKERKRAMRINSVLEQRRIDALFDAIHNKH